MTKLTARNPDIQLDQGDLMWSKVPEFALAINGYSMVIPYVEYYLNQVMREVRENHCANNETLKEDIKVFIKQETTHARLHNRYNKRMLDANIKGLPELIERITGDLKKLRETKSLAFNAAYCAGFESIATYDSQYLFEECDEMFEGADPHGANLILWHVAEEYEHRSVCHDACHAVSSSYFNRIKGLVYAFYHVGGAFVQAEKIMLDHYLKDKSAEEAKAVRKKAKSLFIRQLMYVGPRMLKIFVPGYHPGKLKVPPRIAYALEFFKTSDKITKRVKLAIES